MLISFTDPAAGPPPAGGVALAELPGALVKSCSPSRLKEPASAAGQVAGGSRTGGRSRRGRARGAVLVRPWGVGLSSQVGARSRTCAVLLFHRSLDAAEQRSAVVLRARTDVRQFLRRSAATVSILSAALPHAASRRTTAPHPAPFLSRADVVPSEAAEGHVMGCGWHGMQGVRRPTACGLPSNGHAKPSLR